MRPFLSTILQPSLSNLASVPLSSSTHSADCIYDNTSTNNTSRMQHLLQLPSGRFVRDTVPFSVARSVWPSPIECYICFLLQQLQFREQDFNMAHVTSCTGIYNPISHDTSLKHMLNHKCVTLTLRVLSHWCLVLTWLTALLISPVITG